MNIKSVGIVSHTLMTNPHREHKESNRDKQADPYFKVMLAVVLTALYERDPKYFLPTCGRERDSRAIRAAKNARNAEEFVNSETFDMYCHMLKMRPEFMRNLSPEQAVEALSRVTVTQGRQKIKRHTEVIGAEA